MACLAVLHRQVCLNFCIFFRAVDGGQLPMFLSLLGKFPGNTVALWLAKAKLLWSKAISKTFCSSLWSMLFRLINGIKNRNEHKEFITGFKPDCSSHYSVSWLLAITTQDCRQFEERLEQGAVLEISVDDVFDILSSSSNRRSIACRGALGSRHSRAVYYGNSYLATQPCTHTLTTVWLPVGPHFRQVYLK